LIKKGIGKTVSMVNQAEHHEDVWENEDKQFYPFLAQALNGGKCSISRLGRFTPGKFPSPLD
jgi:hypothetical protein